MTKGWYWSGTEYRFDGIIFVKDEEDFPFGKDDLFNGPFLTFSETKKDAIESYKTSIFLIKARIKEIRLIKKNEERSNET